MSKENAKKATFEDLLKKKLQREKDKFKTKDIYVSSMDKILVFNKPKEEVIFDMADEMNRCEKLGEQVEFFRTLIYKTCPMLQEQELHDALEIVDPLDVVKELFDLQDTMEIGEQLQELLGLGDISDEIKNS